MKKLLKRSVLLGALAATTFFYACKKNHPNPSPLFNFNQVNLVSDQASSSAAHVDTNLSNAWGLTATSTGVIWISSTRKGVSPIYDKTGAILRAAVTVPAALPLNTGSPTGIVFNSTTDFGANKFIFASLDGIITAWATGNNATIVADRSRAGAAYTGLVMAADGGANFLYAANFKAGTVDVFDANFNLVTTKPFADATIPAGFAPFNIQNIGGMLYVTYAKQGSGGSVNGAGNGYVNIFNPNGTLVKRFASQGMLNSPWGVALAPAGFADNQPSILIGDFGDGRINIFDSQGNFRGQLQNKGQVITIDGLWDLDFLNNGAPVMPTDPLFFTAGPGGELHGLLGFLQNH